MSTPTVDGNEILYRQIGPGGNPIYYDPARTPIVHQSLLLPASKDSDGLSLVRRMFRSEIWAAYRPEQPSVRFRLVLLRANRLRQLALELGFQGMTYASSPDSLDHRFGEPWAHCVVCEINRAYYEGNLEAKKKIKEWAMGVANLATAAEVIGPFQEPTENDPYRPAELPT